MPKKKEGEHHDKRTHEVHEKHGHAENLHALEQHLIENMVELQKVHTALLEKFDKLSEQLANLLGLFEMAARSFAEHPSNQVAEKDREFLEKVDKLLEQNKTIAKGLMLVEEKIRERIYGQQRPPILPMQAQASAMAASLSAEEEEKKPEDLFTPSPSGRPLPRL